MTFISTKLHAVLDYIGGGLLIASPWLFGFNELNEANWVAIGIGIIILVMSLLTDYEGGAAKIISMSSHLTLDVLTGLFLAASPWIFNFSDMVYLPHLLIGLLEMGAGVFTVRNLQRTSIARLDRDLTHAH